MKILVTGAKGQLGSQVIDMLKKEKSELGDIGREYRNAEIIAVDREILDISRLEDVISLFKEVNPDIIINSAAYTNVDECEKNLELALRSNAIGARNVAIAAERIGAKLVHISTDYVFEGDSIESYKEYDLTNPKSVYGKTKLLGEKYVQQFSSKYFIVRTAWLYGYNGKNFVYSIMNAAKEKGHLEVVSDQRGNPTNAEDLVHHILKLALTNEYGIYHCTGKGECSWYDFACKILKYSGIKATITDITSDKLERAAKRPSYSSLDNMMLRCSIGDEMREWEEALAIFLKRFNKSLS